jgi:hypothetical protein
MISAAENSNKFQNTRFWKEKSVEDEFTLGLTAEATLSYQVKRYEKLSFWIYVFFVKNIL